MICLYVFYILQNIYTLTKGSFNSCEFPKYPTFSFKKQKYNMGRVKRIWYLSPMRAAKVQASLRIRALSPEPLLLAHTSCESGGTFRQKARSLASLNGWACAVKTCHDGMLEDTNSLDAVHTVRLLKSNTNTRNVRIAMYYIQSWFMI